MNADTDNPIPLRILSFLKSGFYADPEIQGYILEHPRVYGRLMMDVADSCPVGNGMEYQRIATKIFVFCLGSLVDPEFVREEVPVEGGRIDSELPLSLENLHEYSLWAHWGHRYAISSIFLEMKNRRTKGSSGDIRSLRGYLASADRGRFGVLIARSGFSRDAIKTMRGCVGGKEDYLILPFDHSDLRALTQAKEGGSKKVETFFRRKATQLVQDGLAPRAS